VTSSVPANVGAGFDSEIGLTFVELTPDGGTRTADHQGTNCFSPGASCTVALYCSIVESLASVSAHVWLDVPSAAEATVVGVNNNTDFLRAILVGHRHGRCPPRSTAAGEQQLWQIHHHRRGAIAWWPGGQVRLQNMPDE